MRNPAFGSWGDPSAWGETARGPRRGTLTRSEPPVSVSANHCDLCGAVVRWETDGRAGTVAMERGVPHVCDPDRAFAHTDHRPGADILAGLRRVFNLRRLRG